MNAARVSPLFLMVVLIASGLAAAVGSPASAQQPAVAAASTPGVVLSTTKVIAPEQGTAAYTVRLATAPTADVTVTLTRNSDGDADIAFDTDSGTSGDQDTLTFTSTTWSTAQEVTLAAADDTDKLYGTATITHTAASTDSNYSSKTAALDVAEGDNDVCQGTAAVNNATTGGLVDDCNTLLALKTTLAGTATLNPDWNTGTAIATWQGITTANNRVTRLILTKQSLDGTIPNTLGNLAGLRILYLNQNSLTGPIPPSLGNLTNLSRLYLDRQRRDADTNCDNSGLTGTVPPELGNLPNPHTFYLDVNCLTGTIPTSLTKLTSLVRLGLSRNKLTGTIPGEIGNLTNLKTLSLGTNSLTGTIPTQITKLTKLEGLFLHENDLTGTIPAQIGNLTNLIYLLLDRNSLTGTIPTGIGNLTNLITLSLQVNSLSGSIPEGIGNLTKMHDLILSNNSLSGPIPAGIGNLTKMHRLHLNSNSLTGTIPKELGDLSNLSGFWLDNNNLSGSIPKELGNLSSKLHQFFLDNNSLTGPIPKELGNLTNLNALRLHNNQLSGSIPKELGNLTNLGQIYLNDNGLTGSIPEELGNLVPGIAHGNLEHNSLSGCIPPTLAGYSGIINPQKDSKDNNVNLPVCKGVRLSKGSVGVSEGSSATYTVQLTSAPKAEVTVTLTKAGDNDIAFDTDSVVEGNQDTLTFTTGNWNTAQTVTLSAAVDAVHDGGAATITHTTASDPYYDDLTTKLIATEVDTTPVLAAGNITDTSATLAIAKHSGNWYYKADTGPDAACKGPVSTTNQALTGLTPGTSYTYTAHSAGGCGSASLLTTAGAFTTLALTAGGATGTTARLTLANHSGSWYYKSVLTDDEDFRADAGACSSAVAGPTTTLEGLEPATQYIYKAYLFGGCRVELATTPVFSTAGVIVRTDSPPTAHEGGTYSYQVSLATEPAAAVTVQITSDNSDITFTSEKSENTALTFTADNWSNRQDVAVNTGQDADTDDDIATISHAAASTDDSQNGLSATLAFRVVDDDNALEASSVTADSATLTISGHVATWYYQADAAPHTACQGPVSSSPTKALTGLSASTAYTYKAYSDAGCAAELTTDDSDAEFITAAAHAPPDTSSPVTSPPTGGPSTPSGPPGYSPPASPTEPAEPETLYTGAIDGPDYCTNLSLGGPLTRPHDSNGDGIADTCSLPHTRREAIARQNALETFADNYPGQYAQLLAQACAALANTDYGDHPEDLAQDACATGNAQPYTAPDPADPQTLYSGAIDGPDHCTNLSLGGPRTHPHDSNGDGIADTCSLPHTRREAIARQNALQTLADNYPRRYAQLLTQACGALANTDYGDHPENLAQDTCTN